MKLSYVYYSGELEGEYKSTFEQISLYATVHNIIGECLNAPMMKLIKTMINAQNNGQSVETVVGTDLEAFCEEFFRDFGFRQRIAGIYFLLYRLACVFAAVDGLTFILSIKRDHIRSKTKDIFPQLIIFFVIIFVFVSLNALIKRYIFKGARLNANTYAVLLIGGLFLGLLASFLMFNEYTIYVPIIYELLASLAYIALYKTIKYYSKRKSKKLVNI
ncbi:MAG: hypothetical protein Q4F05_17200 [bacterium]|nr:hypothetical protein [bacterium]